MVKISIEEIKFNPFKKFINGGKLEEERIDKLVESIEHGTLQPNFVGRKTSDGKYEISSGHHRLGAFKKKFGKDFKVEFMPVKFSDEQMLVDMVRENLTQRGEGSFRDTEESLVLARKYITNHPEVAKRVGDLPDGQGCRKDMGEDYISAKTISKFLSRNGKAVSRELVRQYLNIYDKLDKNLHKKIENSQSTTGNQPPEELGIRIAGALSSLDKKSQKDVWKQIQENRLNSNDARLFITKYKEDKTITPQIITQQQYQEDYEKDPTEQKIDFKHHWETVSSGYYEDLIQWEHFPEKMAKPELKKLYAQINNIQKQEQKTIQKLKEMVK